MDLLIARKAAEVLIASGYIAENFSFQAGSGTISLSVCQFLKEYMISENITGEFAAGGVTSNLVQLFEEGLFRKLYDVQTFGSDVVSSLIKNEQHVEMSADTYASPSNEECIVNKLDVMILSATEIDVNFNINSVTGSNGVMMGALGGAPDTTAGAKLSIIVAPSIRKRIPIVVDQVRTICTPGKNVDILVTERGISVNPNRTDLIKILSEKGIPIMPISKLKDAIHQLTGVPDELETGDNIVGIIEYRDGSVIDVIYDL
jgi:citrate lyase subunit alpha/citrate CoA-transferase